MELERLPKSPLMSQKNGYATRSHGSDIYRNADLSVPGQNQSSKHPPHILS
jgi:hypothetical protein